MSRVRILNLPNDCTEKELRQHFVRLAPATAPVLEVTDVMIKRLVGQAPPASAARHPLGKIRMAFVGFRTSAAAHFVASYFNNSYFRSSKIRVELAKGLNEVGDTLNMRKKQEKAQQQQQREKEEKEKEKEMKSAMTSSRRGPAQGTGVVGEKRVRGTDAAHEHAGDSSRSEKDEDDDQQQQRRTTARKELFLGERLRATEGPTWASEVLVPHSASTAHADVELDDDALARTAAEAAEEEERQMLAKQSALGTVSDMDFLSGLGTAANADGSASITDWRARARSEGGSSDGGAPGPHSRAGHDDDDNDGDDGDGDGDGASRKRGGPSRTDSSNTQQQQSEEDIAELSRRVRIGNIPYTATEENVKQFAASLVGPVEAVHIPLTKDTRQSKGAAFVRFHNAADAVAALTKCRGAILMGRLLRVSAAEEDPHSKAAVMRDATLASGSGPAAALAGSSAFKIKKEIERRVENTAAVGGSAGGGAGSEGKGQSAASSDTAGGRVHWNSMYVSSHAAVESVAQRLGLGAQDLVSVHVKGAAVRAAIAEAALTSDVQQVLGDEGVALEAIENGQQSLLTARSNTTILVKNLQLASADDAAELSKLFLRFGSIETSVFPSSGTFALLRYMHPHDARAAFTRLSYKLFKSTPLFLEWAPVGAIVEEEGEEDAVTAAADGPVEPTDPAHHPSVSSSSSSPAATVTTVAHTLFVTNLPFTASEDDFHAFLMDSCPRVARSPETLIKRVSLQQKQGRAYITVADAATFQDCLRRLNGRSFDGRVLSCVPSKQTGAAAAAAAAGAGAPESSGAPRRRGGEDDDDQAAADERILRKTAVTSTPTAGSADKKGSKVPPGCDPHKLIVKNVPFEATEADLRELFAAFTEVRSVRLPKKTNHFTTHRENNHRGFAFVEFLSESEAARALETLRATHLYGRHLVLQYAKMDG